ncbi:MAG: hypothetical protein Q9M36_01990 [Sulfurovum sp.]|nr:hypothetical protein [Sulfurovum sp.]
MQRWSASELHDTFGSIKTNKSLAFKALQAKEQKLYKELLADKNKILALENQNKKLQKHKSNTDAMIDALSKNRITLGDVHSLDKNRKFKLVGTGGNEEACRNLFEEVFEKDISVEFWNWKYHGTLWRGVCVEKEGEIIAHYNGMRRDVLYFGKREKALQPCDTMVSPKARGGFKKDSPFYNMVYTWLNINIGRDKDFLLTYGFPNNRAMRLGEQLGFYKEVDTIKLLKWDTQYFDNTIKYHREKYLLKSSMDSEINTLWRSMARSFKHDVICVRDANYVRRRYLLHPTTKYQVYVLRDNDDTLVGLFVLRKTKTRMMLIDIIAEVKDFSLIISEALTISDNEGSLLLDCWITASKVGLFNRHDVEIIQTDISIPISNITPEFDGDVVINKWFLMYGDSDFN